MDIVTNLLGINLLPNVSVDHIGRTIPECEQKPHQPEVVKRRATLTQSSTVLDKIHLTISGPVSIHEVVWGTPSNLKFRGHDCYTASLVQFRLVSHDAVLFDPLLHCSVDYKEKCTSLRSQLDDIGTKFAELETSLTTLNKDVAFLQYAIHEFLYEMTPEPERPKGLNCFSVYKGELLYCPATGDQRDLYCCQSHLEDGYYFP